ncbi:MAG: YraN family protein [Candidatus Omnitrophica bacterium]|nr:YraN family protein [Candidatus Omnitrophota bacterium]
MRRGRTAERDACEFLRRKGYRILKTNIRTRRGEVDILARNGEGVRFIEVKARRAGALCRGREAVTRNKQRRISHVAACYAPEYPGEQLGYDVVEITFGRRWAQYVLIKDAFEHRNL